MSGSLDSGVITGTAPTHSDIGITASTVLTGSGVSKAASALYRSQSLPLSLAKQVNRGFAGRESIKVQDTDEIRLDRKRDEDRELEQLRGVLSRFELAPGATPEDSTKHVREICAILKKDPFCDALGAWHNNLARLTEIKLRGGVSLEEIKREFGISKPTLDTPRLQQARTTFRDGLLKQMIDKKLKGDPAVPSAAAPVAQKDPRPFEPAVVETPIEQDAQLARLLKMQQEDFERWVREIFTPYMQSHFSDFKNPDYKIEPKWVPATMTAPAVRGIMIGTDKKALHYSEISLKENLISIAYKSTNAEDDARYLAMQFAGILFAGRTERSTPILVVECQNFKFTNEKERQSKKDFFVAVCRELNKVGIRYELPDGPLIGPLWDEIKSWFTPKVELQSSSTPFCKQAIRTGSCRTEFARSSSPLRSALCIA